MPGKMASLEQKSAWPRVSSRSERICTGLCGVQQALFAYLDTLAKTILTCVPEPPVEAKPQAVASQESVMTRLLKSAGRVVVGDSKIAMQDLVAGLESRV